MLRKLWTQLKIWRARRHLDDLYGQLRGLESEVLASYDIRNRLLMGGPCVTDHQAAVVMATNFYSESIKDYIDFHVVVEKARTRLSDLLGKG